MRIRTIKPEFFTHPGIQEAEAESGLPLRVAYIGLWCAADREGRFKWDHKRLGVQILPYDAVDFSRVLDVLMSRGYIVKYTSGSGVYGWIPSFSKHQIVNNKERASELPEPNRDIALTASSNECNASATRELRDGIVNGTPLSQDQGEGKGKERKGTVPQRELFDDQSDHYVITQSIGRLYKEVTGEDYAFNTRFAGRLKTFLAGWKGTADEWLDRYKEALEYGTAKFSSHCKNAANPVYLCDHWLEVSAEIAKLKEDGSSQTSKPKPAFSRTL